MTDSIHDRETLTDDPRERVTLPPPPADTEPAPAPEVPAAPEAVAVLLQRVLDEQAAARTRDEQILAALGTLATEVAAIHEDQRRLPCRRPTELPPPCSYGSEPDHPGNGATDS